MDLKKTKPEWFDTNGNLISADARRDLERNQRKAAQAVADEIERRTARPQTDQQRLLGAQENHIRDLKRKLQSCLPSEKQGIQERIAWFSEVAKDLRAEMDEAARLEGFGKNRRVALARDTAAAPKRSPHAAYRHASDESIALAIAIAESNDWESGDALADAFHRQLEIISEQNLAEETRLAERATNDRLLAERDEANAQLAALAARKKLVDAKGELNGD
jgi:hypothetical protein